MERRFLCRFSAVFVFALIAALPTFVHAALPPIVDGQPLPSLAPMLQKVTPAVVNISTKGHGRSLRSCRQSN